MIIRPYPVSDGDAGQWPQPQNPPCECPTGAGMGEPPRSAMSLAKLSPLLTAANTEMARLAGCSQCGQSAPVADMDCNFSNLNPQVGHEYS